jgi:hypothetical protein
MWIRPRGWCRDYSQTAVSYYLRVARWTGDIWGSVAKILAWTSHLYQRRHFDFEHTMPTRRVLLLHHGRTRLLRLPVQRTVLQWKQVCRTYYWKKYCGAHLLEKKRTYAREPRINYCTSVTDSLPPVLKRKHAWKISYGSYII